MPFRMILGCRGPGLSSYSKPSGRCSVRAGEEDIDPKGSSHCLALPSYTCFGVS